MKCVGLNKQFPLFYTFYLPAKGGDGCLHSAQEHLISLCLHSVKSIIKAGSTNYISSLSQAVCQLGLMSYSHKG